MPRHVAQTCPPSYTLGYRVGHALKKHAPPMLDTDEWITLHPNWRELVQKMIPNDLHDEEMDDMRRALDVYPLRADKDGTLAANTDCATEAIREHVGRVIWYVHRNHVRREIRRAKGHIPDLL